MIYLDMTPKALTTKGKSSHMELHKTKKLIHSKRNNQQNKNAAYQRKENTCKSSI